MNWVHRCPLSLSRLNSLLMNTCWLLWESKSVCTCSYVCDLIRDTGLMGVSCWETSREWEGRTEWDTGLGETEGVIDEDRRTAGECDLSWNEMAKWCPAVGKESYDHHDWQLNSRSGHIHCFQGFGKNVDCFWGQSKAFIPGGIW